MAHDEGLYSPLAADPALAAIVAQFVGDLPDRVATLDQAFKLGDMEKLRRLAHQLKGAAGSYGFPVVTDASRRLEDAILHDQPLKTIGAALADIRTIVSRVRLGRPGE